MVGASSALLLVTSTIIIARSTPAGFGQSADGHAAGVDPGGRHRAISGPTARKNRWSAAANTVFIERLIGISLEFPYQATVIPATSDVYD